MAVTLGSVGGGAAVHVAGRGAASAASPSRGVHAATVSDAPTGLGVFLRTHGITPFTTHHRPTIWDRISHIVLHTRAWIDVAAEQLTPLATSVMPFLTQNAATIAALAAASAAASLVHGGVTTAAVMPAVPVGDTALLDRLKSLGDFYDQVRPGLIVPEPIRVMGFLQVMGTTRFALELKMGELRGGLAMHVLLKRATFASAADDNRDSQDVQIVAQNFPTSPLASFEALGMTLEQVFALPPDQILALYGQYMPEFGEFVTRFLDAATPEVN